MRVSDVNALANAQVRISQKKPSSHLEIFQVISPLVNQSQVMVPVKVRKSLSGQELVKILEENVVCILLSDKSPAPVNKDHETTTSEQPNIPTAESVTKESKESSSKESLTVVASDAKFEEKAVREKDSPVQTEPDPVTPRPGRSGMVSSPNPDNDKNKNNQLVIAQQCYSVIILHPGGLSKLLLKCNDSNVLEAIGVKVTVLPDNENMIVLFARRWFSSIEVIVKNASQNQDIELKTSNTFGTLISAESSIPTEQAEEYNMISTNPLILMTSKCSMPKEDNDETSVMEEISVTYPTNVTRKYYPEPPKGAAKSVLTALGYSSCLKSLNRHHTSSLHEIGKDIITTVQTTTATFVFHHEDDAKRILTALHQYLGKSFTFAVMSEEAKEKLSQGASLSSIMKNLSVNSKERWTNCAIRLDTAIPVFIEGQLFANNLSVKKVTKGMFKEIVAASSKSNFFHKTIPTSVVDDPGNEHRALRDLISFMQSLNEKVVLVTTTGYLLKILMRKIQEMKMDKVFNQIVLGCQCHGAKVKKENRSCLDFVLDNKFGPRSTMIYSRLESKNGKRMGKCYPLKDWTQVYWIHSWKSSSATEFQFPVPKRLLISEKHTNEQQIHEVEQISDAVVDEQKVDVVLLENVTNATLCSPSGPYLVRVPSAKGKLIQINESDYSSTKHGLRIAQPHLILDDDKYAFVTLKATISSTRGMQSKWNHGDVLCSVPSGRILEERLYCTHDPTTFKITCAVKIESMSAETITAAAPATECSNHHHLVNITPINKQLIVDPPDVPSGTKIDIDINNFNDSDIYLKEDAVFMATCLHSRRHYEKTLQQLKQKILKPDQSENDAIKAHEETMDVEQDDEEVIIVEVVTQPQAIFQSSVVLCQNAHVKQRSPTGPWVVKTPGLSNCLVDISDTLVPLIKNTILVNNQGLGLVWFQASSSLGQDPSVKVLKNSLLTSRAIKSVHDEVTVLCQSRTANVWYNLNDDLTFKPNEKKKAVLRLVNQPATKNCLDESHVMDFELLLSRSVSLVGNRLIPCSEVIEVTLKNTTKGIVSLGPTSCGIVTARCRHRTIPDYLQMLSSWMFQPLS